MSIVGPQWMGPLSVEGGGSYMDEDLRNASDVLTNPTLDFFGKPVALSDRHVGIDRYMEVDPYHSTDPRYGSGGNCSLRARRTPLWRFFLVSPTAASARTREAPRTMRAAVQPMIAATSTEATGSTTGNPHRTPTRPAKTAPETSVSLRIRAASACSKVLASARADRPSQIPSPIVTRIRRNYDREAKPGDLGHLVRFETRPRITQNSPHCCQHKNGDAHRRKEFISFITVRM